MINNRLADHRAQASHLICKPLWDMSAVQRKIGSPNSSSRQFILSYRFRISPSLFSDRISRSPSAVLVLIWGPQDLRRVLEQFWLSESGYRGLQQRAFREPD